jgi:hypothetical protein
MIAAMRFLLVIGAVMFCGSIELCAHADSYDAYNEPYQNAYPGYNYQAEQYENSQPSAYENIYGINRRPAKEEKTQIDTYDASGTFLRSNKPR